MASQYKTIHPVKYLRDYLAQEIRPDGRAFLRFRPVSVNVGSITQADSSAIFKIGSTTVVCGIKAELAAPRADTPDSGYLIPNVELSPLCSPKFRPGPPSDQSQVASKTIDDILRNSATLDLTDLCIFKDKLVWALYCDLSCIDYDGSVTDACVGALMSALKTLTLPDVQYNPDTGAVVVDAAHKKPFPLKSLPVSTTFAIFDDQLLVADPTDEEETLSKGKMCIVGNENELYAFYKPGGIPVSQSLIHKSLQRSKRRASLTRKVIEAATTARVS